MRYPITGVIYSVKGYLFTIFTLQRLFVMLFILVMYSVKPLPPPEPSSEVEKQISIFTEGKTPEGTEPLFTGLKLTAYHLQTITLPIGGKQELSWIFNLF